MAKEKMTEEIQKEIEAKSSQPLMQKVARLRRQMDEMNIKPSGKVSLGAGGYAYYELGDFMSHVTKLEDELGIVSYFCELNPEFACLKICDCLTGEFMEIKIKTVDSSPKSGGNPIQMLGATNTYLKRYLYLNYLNLSASDYVEYQAAQPVQTTFAAPAISGGGYVPSAAASAGGDAVKAQFLNKTFVVATVPKLMKTQVSKKTGKEIKIFTAECHDMKGLTLTLKFYEWKQPKIGEVIRIEDVYVFKDEVTVNQFSVQTVNVQADVRSKGAIVSDNPPIKEIDDDGLPF